MKAPKPEIQRIPFSEEEIQLLFENTDFPFVDMILIGIYSEWRPQELAILKIANIDLEEMTFQDGLKTEAGMNRIVPIHSKIQPLVQKLFNPKNVYLFNDENGQNGTHMTYDKYRARFIRVCKKLKMNHKPHDTRHTFITKAKNADVNEYILKLIVGHAIADITEKVYTHRTMQELKSELEKIQ